MPDTDETTAKITKLQPATSRPEVTWEARVRLELRLTAPSPYAALSLASQLLTDERGEPFTDATIMVRENIVHVSGVFDGVLSPTTTVRLLALLQQSGEDHAA